MKLSDIKYDRFTYSRDHQYDWISVHGWSTYPENSVLAGQPMKVFLDSFNTVELALEKYPDATPSNKLIEPQNTFDHLPGEDDPVPGGMYPDDWPSKF